jgi:hypothetical protein
VRFLGALSPETRVLVLPQGCGLNFMAGLTGADGLFSHLPMEFNGPAAEAALLEKWQRAPPDVVMWLTMNLREFGYEGFGVDYAQPLAGWLRGHYETAVDGKGFVLLRRPGYGG